MNESKRLSRPERRQKLLEAAFAIVREEGTDALTLARVAERAGVTKPIAYEHFGTRAGLLIEMYRDYDERQTAAMRAALQQDGRTLADVTAILSAAYVDCAVSSGSEYGAITAALAASEEMDSLLQSCRDSFAEECGRAFAPFVRLSPDRRQAMLIAVLGAAEFLSQAAAAGRLTRDQAVDALVSVMTGALRENEK